MHTGSLRPLVAEEGLKEMGVFQTGLLGRALDISSASQEAAPENGVRGRRRDFGSLTRLSRRAVLNRTEKTVLSCFKHYIWSAWSPWAKFKASGG